MKRVGAFTPTRLRLSKNCRLIQKEVRLQGEKGLEKGAEPSFPFVIGIQFVKKQSFFDKLKRVGAFTPTRFSLTFKNLTHTDMRLRRHAAVHIAVGRMGSQADCHRHRADAANQHGDNGDNLRKSIHIGGRTYC